MHVRGATPVDNDGLIDLQARCPQGTDLVVSNVNTPDFFARARAYDDYKVLVATEDNRIVGSTAYAIRDANIDGRVACVGYGFQTFISPDHRRRGVASQLFQSCEDYLARRGVELDYGLIIGGNTPSIRYFGDRGFRLHRTLIMPMLGVYKPMVRGSQGKVRKAEPRDLAAIAQLTNETWEGYDFYEPISAETLASAIDRRPAFSIDDLFVLEVGGEIAACLGLWDWSKTAQITIRAVSLKLRMIGLLVDLVRHFRPMPVVPRLGAAIKQSGLTPIAFRDPTHFAVLLRHVNDEALSRGIQYMFCACERGNPMLQGMKDFVRVDTALHLYVRPLKGILPTGTRPVFIDMIDC
ncbi:MAG: GNAT family N-acetyltransferase [Chloroflexi bacterium]|nr:GNAT family N-acetyltransferase [Chloroflexota bacterium]